MRTHVWLAALALSLGLAATAFGQIKFTPFGPPSNAPNFSPFSKPSNAVTFYPFGGPNATPTPQQSPQVFAGPRKLNGLFSGNIGFLSNTHVFGASSFPDPQSQPIQYLQQFGFTPIR
jgi:hypothetical protein